MEIIRLEGYTEDEKVEIAKRHLIAKQIEAHGLKAGEFSAEDATAVEAFLGHYLLNEIYRQLLLKAIKVNVIGAILVLEKRILDALQTSRIRGTDKRRIGRRLVDNCFPGFAKSTDSSIKSGNDAWNETDLGLKNIPIV